jgi:hypothetical protein
MEIMQGNGHIVRKVALWTLIGFGVLVLSGPILSLLGVLLPFALVGGLVWLVVKGVMAGPQAVGHAIGATFRAIGAGPRWVGGKALSGVRFVGRNTWRLAGFTGRLLLPLIAGGLVFGVLGAVGGAEHHDAESRVPMAILIGAGVGLLAHLMWPKSSTSDKIPTVLPADQMRIAPKKIVLASMPYRHREPRPPASEGQLAKVVLVSESRG